MEGVTAHTAVWSLTSTRDPPEDQQHGGGEPTDDQDRSEGLISFCGCLQWLSPAGDLDERGGVFAGQAVIVERPLWLA
jgi:hypothetical protein